MQPYLAASPKPHKNKATDYLETELGKAEIPVKEEDLKGIKGFASFLKATKAHTHNWGLKFVRRPKKIIRITLAKDWMSKYAVCTLWKRRCPKHSCLGQTSTSSAWLVLDQNGSNEEAN